eukprot:4292165-Pyramimonas_sp.AAC.1
MLQSVLTWRRFGKIVAPDRNGRSALEAGWRRVACRGGWPRWWWLARPGLPGRPGRCLRAV